MKDSHIVLAETSSNWSDSTVDTVGAGDTFNAGFLARLSERGLLRNPALAEIDAQSLGEALEYGAKVAAITVSRAGANTPWRDEIAT
ncbi:MAG: hypothetical protein HRU33_24380 [Rhodobacteraceae bacterium]|nr:hypothetical protein [Paracoccaceae bacterium]